MWELPPKLVMRNACRLMRRANALDREHSSRKSLSADERRSDVTGMRSWDFPVTMCGGRAHDSQPVAAHCAARCTSRIRLEYQARSKHCRSLPISPPQFKDMSELGFAFVTQLRAVR